MKKIVKRKVLRSSKILISKHRINPYLEKIDKTNLTTLKPNVRPSLRSAHAALIQTRVISLVPFGQDVMQPRMYGH